jgi:hypothetical protein
MYCKVIVNNGSVVIYYGVGGIMRFPTGAKISKIKDKQKKLKQWDYKNDRVNSDVENSAKMNKAIADWLTKADNIVSQYLIDYGINIPAPELKKKYFLILSKVKSKRNLNFSCLIIWNFKNVKGFSLLNVKINRTKVLKPIQLLKIQLKIFKPKMM